MSLQIIYDDIQNIKSVANALTETINALHDLVQSQQKLIEINMNEINILRNGEQ